jgi:hypothetical protein
MEAGIRPRARAGLIDLSGSEGLLRTGCDPHQRNQSRQPASRQEHYPMNSQIMLIRKRSSGIVATAEASMIKLHFLIEC